MWAQTRMTVLLIFLKGKFESAFDHFVHVVVAVFSESAAEDDFPVPVGQRLVAFVKFRVALVIVDIMTDVWRFPITNTAERDDAGGHATPKPIALCERAILSSSRPGELVVDFFGGSGSTLIACENTGRTCAMIELEPKWCDVIVRRYIKTTGDNNVRCVRQGRELPREEIAAIFEPDEEGGEQE